MSTTMAFDRRSRPPKRRGSKPGEPSDANGGTPVAKTPRAARVSRRRRGPGGSSGPAAGPDGDGGRAPSAQRRPVGTLDRPQPAAPAVAEERLSGAQAQLLGDLFAIVEEHAGEAAIAIDRDAVREAFVFACAHHADQRRKSGEEFISHPVGVAKVCAGMRLDTETLCAALLHDTVEDTSASLEEVRERFGEEVAGLVDGVTKLTGITFQSRDEAQAENYRKMMVAMASDIRVVLIKLADTLHPRKYQEIKALVSQQRAEREEYVIEAGTYLARELAAVGIEAEISGRAKHFYSIYTKMTKKGREFNEIYDLTAMRVLVDSVKDCYGAIGVIHSLWKPLPGRFKDFVAMPKFNGYQALHTTVIGPEGRPLEIQIRTHHMHRTAEYGVAAHWLYKDAAPDGGRGGGGKTHDERGEW